MANKQELIELLERLHEYMKNRADVNDVESNVDNPQNVAPNEEMDFMTEIDDMLHFLGVNGHGDEVRMSVDGNYGGKDSFKYDHPMNENIEKIKSEFKRYL